MAEVGASVSEFVLPDRLRELYLRIQTELVVPASAALADALSARNTRIDTARKTLEAVETAVTSDIQRERTHCARITDQIASALNRLASIRASADKRLRDAHVAPSGSLDLGSIEGAAVAPPYVEAPIPSDNIAALEERLEALEKSQRPRLWPKRDEGKWAVGCSTVMLLFVFWPLVATWPLIFLVLLYIWKSDLQSSHAAILHLAATLEASLRVATAEAKTYSADKISRAETTVLKPARAQCEDVCRAAEREHSAQVEQIQASFRGAVDDLHAEIDSFWTDCGYIAADWASASWQTWVPDASPEFGARVGTLRIDTADLQASLRDLNLRFDVPSLVPFATGKCLLLAAHGPAVRFASDALQSLLLRVLASTPPGKARFTFIDPVGLGHNVADFMALGDYAADLIGGKAWTEPRHINEQLSELTEHMETVIQKYLRKEFASILDYNAKAEEVAEPFRFVVVFDFPVNFTEESARRLVSIVRNGPRCGVFTFIVRDTSKPLPYGFAMDDLEASASAITWESGPTGEWTPRWQDPLFGTGCTVVPDALGDAAGVAGSIVSASGDAASAAMKVEVPFDKLLALAGFDGIHWWTASTASALRVPLGPTGARRLQTLVLGEGLAHHVLVVGRTGSGKTNLLHVIISVLAMSYSPDELELYLVDFKGGVGFKPYAVHRLAHAAVIAIESEREFGLSVLKGLDAELRRRFDIFRSVGVDNLPDYRARAGSSRGPMPRVLLVVDEYQELFAQDDGLAQQARSILDRIVRQGRSFGLHILLGTQSLAGTAQLPTSTMGQMAVRIALPCNESDARLIFSDDNAAARFLSNPGEAIYNGGGGAIEANSPFQVALFTDSDLRDGLQTISKLAVAAGHTREPIVFEGSEPAVVEEQSALAALVRSRKWPSLAHGRAWLGEPVAILPSVESSFARRSGRHLLIVGHDEAQAVGVLQAAWISLLCHHRPTAAQFFVLDLATAETPWSSFTENCRSLFDHEIETVTRRTLPTVLGNLADEIGRRLDASSSGNAVPPIYLIVQGLQRARDLRVTDSYYPSRGSEKTAADLFGSILRDGSEVGVHVLGWCDTVSNARRSVDRALPEFGLRVAGPMSADDSNVLVDSAEASRLNKPYRLLFVDEEKPGLVQKFRPYALPRLDWVEEVARQQRQWQS